MNDLKRVVIVLVGFVALALCAFGVKGHMDSDGYKNQVNYATAVQASNKDLFNYALDSQQGRVLTNGELTAKGKLAKFDEMTQGFTYVDRTLEHYTAHTSCGGKPVTCHTYYTWDSQGSEERYSDKVTLYGREYPTTLFFYGKFAHDADACIFTAKDTSTGWFSSRHGCDSGMYYLDGNDRYVYTTVPTTVRATFLSSTYGGLKPFSEDRITLQDKSISQVLKDVGKYQLIGFWVATVLFVVLAVAAVFVAYAWVMRDGSWSMDR